MRPHMKRVCIEKRVEKRIGLAAGSEKTRGSKSVRGEIG